MRSRASYKILRALTLNRSLPVAGGDLVGAEGKGQNHVEEYQTIIQEWHDGFTVDPVAVHLGKRAKEVFHLLIAWAKFLKEMEEVWLQTRKKSEREERWLAVKVSAPARQV